LFDRKVPIAKISRLMGHATEKETRKYLALDDEDDREAMDTIRDDFGVVARPPTVGI
jgi:hypothetical protein